MPGKRRAKMKWRSDGGFCSWMVDVGYAAKGAKTLEPFVSEGLCVYLWEAWLAALASAPRSDPTGES